MENENQTSTELNTFLEELYVARCKDTLEQPSREEFMRFKSRLKPKVTGLICSLRNQHLGVSAANTLSKFFRNRTDLIKLDLYTNLIRDHGLQVVSHFVQLNKYIKIFNIGCNDLTDKSAPQLANIVLANHLQSLQLGIVEKSLHPNKITSITLDALSDAIVKTNSLLSLGLNGSSFGAKPAPNAPSVESALIRVFSKSSSLLNISLSHCQISNQAMLDVIEKGLCFNSTLQRIDISDNQLNSQVGIRLGSFLLEPTKEIVIHEDAEDPEVEYDVVFSERNPKIFYVRAANNCFNHQVATIFANVLKSYSHLGFLDLSGNEIGDDGAIQIASAISTNQTLVELHLSANKITSLGGVALANALKENSLITTLNISQNKLGDETALALADALANNTTIISLNISSSMLSNNGGITIAGATLKCPNLIKLDMSDNFFTEDAGSAIEKTFRDNYSILKINVSGTQINHFSFHALNEICLRNESLLKQQEQKPLRNQFVKSQYSLVELQRKEKILEALISQKNELQEQIDALNETIRTHKNDEEHISNMLTKQIQEKEAQMETEKVDFADKKSKLDETIKELEQKKQGLQASLDFQIKRNAEIRATIDQRKLTLQKMNEDFEAAKAAKLAEIELLNKKANELLALSRDSETLAQMETLPEFIVFDDEKAPIHEEVKIEPPPPTEPVKPARGGNRRRAPR